MDPTVVAGKGVRSLYLLVLLGVVAGVAVGWARPAFGASLGPLGDGFIQLIRMLVAPIVFVTVVGGIARMGDLRAVGRVGLKSLIYFEVVTTFALALGLLVGELWQPGASLHVDPGALSPAELPASAPAAGARSGLPFAFRELVPETFFSALSEGKILQVLFVSVLVGLALAALRPRVQALVELTGQLGDVVFWIMGRVLWLAPVGAFGAMAFTVGKFGLVALGGMAKLILAFYATAALFVALVLGLVLALVGLNVFQLVRYLADELLLVLGTSSSESALVPLMAKLEALGCRRSVVDLVVPTGYSFNLDGTSIYLTLATLFIAQALHVPLSLPEELGLLAVLLVTSKGAATVVGGGFITLSATLAATGRIPAAGLALILGVDRFMSEARALTNLVGNAVATLAVARMEGALDVERAKAVLAAPRHGTG